MKSLLVVEPHPALAGLRTALQRQGWSAEVCPSLLDAVVRLAQRPRAALLVHQEAFAGTPDPLEEIRRQHPHMVIVATTSGDGPGRPLAGADETFPLPCHPASLTGALEKAHESRRLASLLDETRRENEQLREMEAGWAGRRGALEMAISRLGQALPDPSTLMKVVLDLFREMAQVQRLSLMLLEGDRPKELRIVQAEGLPHQVVSTTRLRPGEGVAGWVAERGQPLWVHPRPLVSGAASDARGYKSDHFLCLPLKLDGEVVGVINLTERLGGRPFTETEVKELGILASQAAVWIRQAQKLQRAEQLSLVDQLTALYNRRYFLAALAREIGRAKRTGLQFSLAMLDIDLFKLYNDAHGHPAGDELLRQFALVLQKNVRSADIVCRYGGEEFAIILPKTEKGTDHPSADGAHFVDRLRVVISKFPFVGLETQPGGRLTVSAGVAVFPEDGETAEALIAAADEMLYKAKTSGRNRVCCRARAVESARAAATQDA